MKRNVVRQVKTYLPTEYGDITVYGYSASDNKEHIALVKGELGIDNVLCRVHSECLTGEVFGSLRCDCKEQLITAFEMLKKSESGIIVYLRQEGRGIGVLEKLKAYNLQDKGMDTYEANKELGHEPDLRDYGIAVQILQDLNINSIRMMTNNPDKIAQLESYGITVIERVPIIPNNINEYNKKYLDTKKTKMNHLL